MMRDGEQRLRVLVVDERGRSVPATGLASWLRRVAPANARGTVNIALVSDDRIRALNRTYRRKNYATDVLSFPAISRRPSSPPPRTRRTRRRKPDLSSASSVSSVVESFLGDIVIARGVAKRQAREAAHDEATELRVLALHGLLHLLGYDHERDDGRMRRTEERLRRKGGLASGLISRRRPVLDTREGHRPSASGAAVGPRANKKRRRRLASTRPR
jgi:probable rRNA maturation factor